MIVKLQRRHHELPAASAASNGFAARCWLVTHPAGAGGPYMTGIWPALDAACSVSIIPAPQRGSAAVTPRYLRRESGVRRRDPRGDGGGRGGSRQRRHRSSAARRDHLRSGYISGEQLMYARKGAVSDIFGLFPAGRRQAGRGLEIHRELLWRDL